jgi:hypothetical protein
MHNVSSLLLDVIKHYTWIAQFRLRNKLKNRGHSLGEWRNVADHPTGSPPSTFWNVFQSKFAAQTRGTRMRQNNNRIWGNQGITVLPTTRFIRIHVAMPNKTVWERPERV